MVKLNKLIKRWKEIIIITLTIKLFLIFFSIALSPDQNFFSLWNRWDYSWYIDIARDWYQPMGRGSFSIVFSPLYPILIRLATFITHNFLISTIFVSIFFSFTASILLFELTLLDFERRVSFLAVWFLNVFPAAYFLQASYTESLYLTLSLLTIYLFRKNLFVQSGIVGILTSITRLNGILLISALLTEIKSIKKSIITFIMFPLGTLFYLIINYYIFHDPFYFLKPLGLNWYVHTDWPWVGIKNVFSSIPPTSNVNYYIYFSEAVSILFLIIATIYVFLKIRKSYGIYMFVTLLSLTSNNFILGTPRHILPVFPIFIALATIRSKIIIFIISTASLILLTFFTGLYTQGQWTF